MRSHFVLSTFFKGLCVRYRRQRCSFLSPDARRLMDSLRFFAEILESFFLFLFTSHVVVYVRLYLRYLTFFSFLFCLKIYSIMSLWWPAGEIGRRRLRSSDWLVVVVVSIKKWMVRSRATTTHRTMLLIVYYTLWSLLLAVVVLHISISLSGIPTGELYGRSSLSRYVQSCLDSIERLLLMQQPSFVVLIFLLLISPSSLFLCVFLRRWW